MQLVAKRPVAVARLRGNRANSGLVGTVRFYQMSGGILVEAEVKGLPNNPTGFFGFHIHEGSACVPDAFGSAGAHLGKGEHPRHAGDLPPLLSRNGSAYMAVMTDRFSIPEILGRTVIIHMDADDFVSQPGGNAGERIACGRVERQSLRKM